jgi:pimeloyl-ACP methyl ester carboxylesterase
MAEPLVLLHGIGSFRHAWEPVAALVSSRFAVLAVDLPGFGDRPPLAAATEPTPVALAHAVAGVLDDHGWDTAHVAGNSLGGWVALELARLGRTRSVCAISPAGFWRGWERRYAETSLRIARATAIRTREHAPRIYSRPRGRRLAYGQMMTHGERLPAGAALAAARNLADSPGWDATLAAMSARTFEGGADVPRPVTVAWGERDRLLLRTPQAARARGALPQARHIVLAGCGHVPMSDDPAQVARAIITSA